MDHTFVSGTNSVLSNLEVSIALDATRAALSEGASAGVIEDLSQFLGRLYDDAVRTDSLARYRQICLGHSLSSLLREDPFTRRAYEKPRGYPGDAVMLDFIYRPNQSDASAIGAIIHQATSSRLGTPRSILWRRECIAGYIAQTVKRVPLASIMSVANGHMRELDLIVGDERVRDATFIAIDSDELSLQEAARSYGYLDIHSLPVPLTHLLRERRPPRRFDLIYSAGLLDYLSDRAVAALLQNLFARLNPGAIVLLGNFAPDTHGRGYLEFMMDWSLIYRDEKDLADIARDTLPPNASYRTFRDEPGNVVYLEVTCGAPLQNSCDPHRSEARNGRIHFGKTSMTGDFRGKAPGTRHSSIEDADEELET